jgi:hypothetical protein
VAEPGLVGSLNVPPPTGQTFAHIKTWEDLWSEYEYLVNNAKDIGWRWWKAAEWFQEYVNTLDAVAANFQKIVNDLGAWMSGAAADALATRGGQIVKHIQDVADTARKYPGSVDRTGHDIVVHSFSFNEAQQYFVKFKESEIFWIGQDLKAWFNHMNAPDYKKLKEQAEALAARMIEENYQIPHHRRLLMILADKYVRKGSLSRAYRYSGEGPHPHC